MKAETFTDIESEKISTVITITEDDVLEKCPWLATEQVREVVAQLTAYYHACTGAISEVISDTVTNSGFDSHKWVLETRLGRNDTWTCVGLRNEKALDDELLYRIKGGWEVRLPEYTKKLCNDEALS